MTEKNRPQGTLQVQFAGLEDRDNVSIWRGPRLAAAQTGRFWRCPLHSGGADALDGPGRGDPQRAGSHDGERQGGSLSARSRQTVPCFGAEHAVALRLHLCRDLQRLGLCRLRHRCLCQADRRLAGESVSPSCSSTAHRSRFSGTGTPRSPPRQKQRARPSPGSWQPIHLDPWRSFEAAEFATLEWVDRFNHRRLLEPIGNIPPAEAEKRYYAIPDKPVMAA